jgi:hypothetical protein
MVADAQKLQTAAEAAMAALNAHNADPTAAAVNAGPLSIVRGAMATVNEQLAKHIRESSPAPQKTS